MTEPKVKTPIDLIAMLAAAAIMAALFCLFCYGIACFIRFEFIHLEWQVVRGFFAGAYLAAIIKIN